MNLIAIAMVLISVSGIAYFIISKEIRHCAAIDVMIRLLTAVKNKALLYDKPFADILSELENDAENKKIPLLKKFCDCIDGGKEIPEAWNDAVLCMNGLLDSYECQILTRYGAEMCRCNKEEIAEISASVIDELTQCRKKAVQKKNSQSKSVAAITVSSGIIFVLMFA